MSSTSETMEYVLKKCPEARDDYGKLMANIWQIEIGKDRLANMGAIEMLALIANAKKSKLISYPNTIIRSRNIMQELMPHLGKDNLEVVE